MQDFIADMRKEYASMTLADWSYWLATMTVTSALLVIVLATS